MNASNTAASLAGKKAAIDRELERLLEGENRLAEAMRYAVLSGGKRYRALLLLASGEGFGGARETLLPFACGIELIHNYSLVHDDLPCMDDDDFRRGRPSSHRKFGEGLALLAGDALQALAFEVMAGAPAGAAGSPRKERAIVAIGRAAGCRGMIEGQWLDISYSPEAATEKSLYELFLKKTGALILASVLAGAELGERTLRGSRPGEYGRGLGLAFQLRDDILDSSKETETVVPPHPNAVALFGVRRQAGFSGASTGPWPRSTASPPARGAEGSGLHARSLDGMEAHG